MLHDLLAEYLNDVESAVQGLKDAYVEFYEEEIIASDRINLWIRLRFSNGYLLELNESVVAEGEIKHLGYRYHFQDEKNNLVFRYDNTPHFPKLKSFPNHKHTQSEVAASNKPSILDIIEETKARSK